MLYVATARVAFVAVGARALPRRLGRRVPGHAARARARRRTGCTRGRRRRSSARSSGQPAFRQDCQSYQEVQSLYSIAHGGWAAPASARARSRRASGHQIIPYLNTDFIYSALAQELGLIGAAGLLLLYMVFVLRGFRIALFAGDGFSKLLAAGLTFGFALQTFIIVGGILRVIPLTGITLPLVSYGGSSIVANFLVARRADARLEPCERASWRARGEPPAEPARARRGRCCSSRSSSRRRTGRRGRPRGCRTGRTTRSSASCSSRSRAASSRARTRRRCSRRTSKKKLSGQTLYFRRYPQHKLAAQTIGYSTLSRSQAGLERSMNDYLTGANTNLSRRVQAGAREARERDRARQQPRADDPAEGAAARRELLGTRCGAVVAMNPHTGAVYVMASTPTYDPNLIEQPNGYAQRAEDPRRLRRRVGALQPRDAGALRRRARRSRSITAAAALDTGTFNAELEVRRSRLLHGVRHSRCRTPATPTRAGARCSATSTSSRRSSTRSTRCSATSACKLGAGHDPRVREEVRLLQDAAARDAGERARAERPLQRHARSTTRRIRTRSTRGGSRSGRSGCS